MLYNRLKMILILSLNIIDPFCQNPSRSCISQACSSAITHSSCGVKACPLGSPPLIGLTDLVQDILLLHSQSKRCLDIIFPDLPQD